MPDQQTNEAPSSEAYIAIAGTEIEQDKFDSLVIDLDQNQPDMCILSLNNEGHTFSNSTAHGDSVEVKMDSKVIFKGEVVSVEPKYELEDAEGGTKCVIRAYNRLHRLLRGRKSRTFLEMKDSEIASQVAQDAGLTAQATATSVKHAHVYQHNQTNLEFLRLRAARNGFEVRVEDTKLIFDKRKVDEDSSIELKLEQGESATSMSYFAARMSSAAMVNKVVCRGWDPEKKEEIVGTAEAKSSKLGKTAGYTAASTFGTVETFEVDHPVFSQDEAKAIAEGRLQDLLMTYITGEAACKGNPDLKPGIVIKITVNPNKADDKFNGKYFVAGVTHSYSFPKEPGGGGFRTTVRLRRDAEGG